MEDLKGLVDQAQRLSLTPSPMGLLLVVLICAAPDVKLRLPVTRLGSRMGPVIWLSVRAHSNWTGPWDQPFKDAVRQLVERTKRTLRLIIALLYPLSLR